MAFTATLIEAGHNRLRYLLTNTTAGAPQTLNITCTGAATPDLLTDAPYGPVRRCANVVANGLGALAAGVQTQTNARAIWLALNADTVLGNSKIPRCIPTLVPQGQAAGITWTVDANVDSSGNPLIVVTVSNTGTAFLDLATQGAIGI